MVLHKHIQKTVFSNHNFYEGPALQLGMEVTNPHGTATLSNVVGVVRASQPLLVPPRPI